jgi:hypothetical protein
MEDQSSRTDNTVVKVVHMGSYREGIGRTCRKKNAVRVQVEVACNEPVGENIKSWLTEELGKLDGVVVVDRGPHWVLSIIAFHYGHLVELSLILRQFFRASKPGTEKGTSTPSDGKALKPGAWVYESLRFHGLFGVWADELKGLLASIAEEFGKNHLGQASKRELHDRSEGHPYPKTFPND